MQIDVLLWNDEGMEDRGRITEFFSVNFYVTRRSHRSPVTLSKSFYFLSLISSCLSENDDSLPLEKRKLDYLIQSSMPNVEMK